MKVQFFEGSLQSEEGHIIPVAWARSEFGVRVQVFDQIREIEASELGRFSESILVTVVDLEGLDSVNSNYIVDALLKGRYYKRPGVRGKLDTALYLLINEALGELSRPMLD